MAENVAKVNGDQYPIEDDIAYRGPLSYRHFKIIGWLLFVVQMLIPPLKLACAMDPFVAQMLAVPLSVMEVVAPLSVVFLLFADFSQLLVKRDYKRMMIVNGGIALAIIVIFELVYHRYIVGSLDAFVENRAESLAMCDMVFSSLNPMGFLAFNVFIDLFLCTCVMFFLNYEPTKYLTGEKRKLFRALAILPVVYELVCLWLKLEAHSEIVHVPISVFPFLTTKPPMLFFVFCAIVFREARAEERFYEGGRTHDEFVAYLGTNRNTWDFAKFAFFACLIGGLIDLFIILITLSNDWGANISHIRNLPEAAQTQWLYNMVNRYANAGFGGAVDLLVFAPILLLFNCTKTYKNTEIENAIPVCAVALLIVLYLEGGLITMGAVADITKSELLPVIEKATDKVESLRATVGEDNIKYLESLMQGPTTIDVGSVEVRSTASSLRPGPVQQYVDRDKEADQTREAADGNGRDAESAPKTKEGREVGSHKQKDAKAAPGKGEAKEAVFDEGASETTASAEKAQKK